MRRWHLSASLLLLCFHVLWAPLFVASLSTPFLLLPSRHISMLELCCCLHHLWFHLTGTLTTPLSSHWPIKCYLASLISINHFTPPSKNLSDSLLTKPLRSMVWASLNPFLTLPDFSFMHPKLQEPKSSLTLRHIDLGVFPWPHLSWEGIFPISLGPNPASLSRTNSYDSRSPRCSWGHPKRKGCVCVRLRVRVLDSSPSWRDWSMPGSPCETHTAQSWRQRKQIIHIIKRICGYCLGISFQS